MKDNKYITKKIIGKTSKPLSPEEFKKFFIYFWGEKALNLPSFPKIIGHIKAYYQNAEGNVVKVSNFKELITDYTNKKTASITISDTSNDIKSEFIYLCAKAEAKLIISGYEDSLNEKITLFKNFYPKKIQVKKRNESYMKSKNYDVVLSYASEQRKYVEKVYDILIKNGVNVFYDNNDVINVDIWGKNLPDYLHNIYSGSYKYCVMFISKEYKEKIWTNHERKSILQKTITEKNDCVLPIKFDNVEIDGLQTTINYKEVNDFNPRDVANLILKKLGKKVFIPLVSDKKSDSSLRIHVTKNKKIFHFKLLKNEKIYNKAYWSMYVPSTQGGWIHDYSQKEYIEWGINDAPFTEITASLKPKGQNIPEEIVHLAYAEIKNI